MDVTPIRPSQFITRTGPGALTPTVEGSMLIPQLSTLVQELMNSGSKASVNFSEPDSFGKTGLQKFEINDSRMERMLRHFNSKPGKSFEKNIKMFRLPTNADLRIKEIDPILKGFIFPRWGLCTQHKGYGLVMQFSQKSNFEIILDCPKCRDQNIVPIRGSPVRFVQACTNGHLQDLYWPYLVHSGGNNCSSKLFEWRDIGGDNFIIKCTKCREYIDYLGSNGLKIRSINGRLKCQGNFPEINIQSYAQGSCSQVMIPGTGMMGSRAKLVMLNSTGLHTPKNLTSVQIPSISGPLYRELFPHRAMLKSVLLLKPDLDKITLLDHLKQLGTEFTNDTINEIERTPENELLALVNDIVSELTTNSKNNKTLSESQSNNEELNSLLEAAKTGYPPSAKIGKKHAYVNIEDIIKIQSPEFGVTFRISPIKELRVIKTQVGYSREIGTTDDALDSTNSRVGTIKKESNHYDDDTTRWYLSDENIGEGVFIDIIDSEIKNPGGLNPIDHSSSDNVDTWNSINSMLEDILTNSVDYDEVKKDELKQEITHSNPRFVWWHTLCHKLLLNLTVDSGISLVSFGERVYCKKNTRTGKYQSGILIYSSATGSDGTLGGLVSLVEEQFMTKLFKTCSQGIVSCSNDPVCSERKIELTKKEGACCHACELLSETTCSYQNRCLDRNLVQDTMP